MDGTNPTDGSEAFATCMHAACRQNDFVERGINEEKRVADLRCFVMTGMLKIIPACSLPDTLGFFCPVLVCPVKNPRSPMAAAY